MRISVVRQIATAIFAFLAIAACASLQKEPMVLEPGERTLLIKVESFKFEPNAIKAHRGIS